MGKAELECPNCGHPVALGDITCSNCGVNLKSGETYDTRVKRARGKAKHQELYTGGLYVGVVLAFALITFAGYMYQRRMEKVMRMRSDMFVGRIQKLQRVQDLAAAGQYRRARQKGEALVEELDEAAGEIEVDVPFSPENIANPMRRRPEKTEWSKRAARRMLWNLKAKAENVLEEIPAS